MSHTDRRPAVRSLSAAIIAGLLLPMATGAFAQDSASTDTAPSQDAKKKEATNLDKVLVTGSLIPQTQLETFQPVTVITAEDISARGFSSVSEVLQKSTFATGGVQGAQTSASFTQGADTVSLFGLPASYTKYLIDGRPMANYPALYNGSDAFNNISGIPIDLVDRIEILPGGQSSLYGSDALAGVINIILKKKMDGPVFNIRGGGYSEGGGSNFRVGLADGFTAFDGRLNVIAGIQYEERDPIWGYQRDLTKQFNTKGTTTPVPSRDFLVYGYQNWSGATKYSYLWPTGANCDSISGLFGGTEGQATRPGASFGTYCGSYYTPGYRTLLNEKKALQGYAHASFDISDNTQLYADVLLSKENVKYQIGSGYTWWGTSSTFGYYYDPRYDALLNLQRAFAPEEMGGFENAMSEDKSKSYSITLGAKGTFGSSDWDYDFSASRNEYKLDEISFVRWAAPMEQYFRDHVLGPQQGYDPYYGAYPVFTPDYAAFYTPISQSDFAAMTGHATNKSKTYNNLLRAQITNGSLFSLPGGDAGLAVAVEYGKEGWKYDPYPGYLTGEIWGQTSTGATEASRERYALVTELRLPVFEPLTVTASGRYDAFKSGGETIDKSTYSLGLEYRPFQSLLLRGKYGTAFRSVSLPDQYQALSGAYGYVTDYYQCATHGYDPAVPTSIEACPSNYSNRQIYMQTAGGKSLDPINADVWNVGLVWSPISNLSFTADYYAWNIKDEISAFAAGATLFTEYRCRTGIEDITSPTCVDALSRVTRNSAGNVTQVYAPKVNVASQTERAATFTGNYALETEGFGDFNFRLSYTQILSHKYLAFKGDEEIDLLDDPYYSTDPKRKADASVGWHIGDFTTTLYANWIDKTPNYIASISSTGYAAAGAGKLPSYTTYNLSLTYNAFPGMDLSVMVNNLTNKMPPYDSGYPGSSGAPYNSYNYDVYGRAFYFEMRYAFGKK